MMHYSKHPRPFVEVTCEKCHRVGIGVADSEHVHYECLLCGNSDSLVNEWDILFDHEENEHD